MSGTPREVILQRLAEVEDRNAPLLDQVAGWMLATIASDGLILTGGTGHSTALVLETFYRAGGLACVRPLVHPALSPFEGGLASTQLERVTGLGTLLVEAAAPSSRDLGFVFSNSGVNPVPVEMAEALRAAGCKVVAVSSVQHMGQAPRRAGHKLADLADVVLDTTAPYGDALWPTRDGSTAPFSSLASVFLWDLLLVRLAELAARREIRLPLWASANVEGGDARNRELMQRYRPRIPQL